MARRPLLIVALGDVAGNSNFYFGATAGLAQNPKSRADTPGPLTHPQQPLTAVPARLHKLRIDAAAIVTHHHAQAARQIHDLGFDVGRLGMEERVDQRLPSDEVELLPDGGVQRLRLS